MLTQQNLSSRAQLHRIEHKKSPLWDLEKTPGADGLGQSVRKAWSCLTQDSHPYHHSVQKYIVTFIKAVEETRFRALRVTQVLATHFQIKTLILGRTKNDGDCMVITIIHSERSFKTSIKTHRKLLKSSNLVCTVSLTQRQLLQNMTYTLWAVQNRHLFPLVDLSMKCNFESDELPSVHEHY